VLDRDISNKWKNHKKVHDTQQYTDAIPFLRTPHLEWNKLTKSPRGGRNDGERSQRSFSQQGNNTFTAGF
jgi:hypothetical protein|tara:strand:- start:202 stop:411 length:210 start_codon:yes stop_codon:yes gene_type:complete